MSAADGGGAWLEGNGLKPPFDFRTTAKDPDLIDNST